MHKAVFVVLFVSVALSQPPAPAPSKPTNGDQKQTNSKGDVRRDHNGDAESVSTGLNQLSAEVKSWKDQYAAAQKENNPPTEGWTKWSTIATAAATLAIAILGGFQWWAMHKQRAAMELQANYMKDALIETQKASNAALSSAETSKRALYISQRPLITVEVSMAGGIYDLAVGTSEADKLTNSIVRVAFRNVGNTVAREFYFAIWITGDFGRHLICNSMRKPMIPGEAIEETTKKFVSLLSLNETVGFIAKKTKVCGFVRYKTLFDELPGVYIEFHALWDKSIRQFRITTDEREDGGYPEPS